MRKGLLVSLMSIAAISSSLAGAKHNVYVGLGAANVIGNHNAVTNFVTTNVPPTTQSNSFQSANSTGGLDLLIGYMAALNNFTVGAEVDYLFGNLNKTNSTGFSTGAFTDTQKIESTGGAWGFGIRLGYTCLDRIYPYIRLGIENRRFKITSIATQSGFSNFTSISTSNRKTAFTPGVGVDFKLNKSLAMGLEYRYAFYSSITQTGPSQTIAGAIVRTATMQVKPRVSTALISLKYIWVN